MDNGVLVSDEEKEILKNTSSIKPENVRGKLLGRLGTVLECVKIMIERVDPLPLALGLLSSPSPNHSQMFCIHKNIYSACSYLVYKSSLNSDSLWYQSWGTFTNMNIFGSILSKKAMIKRTSGGDGCDSPGDYLRFVNLI